MENKPIDLEVDARGLTCPVPILRAKKALANMESGQVLHVLATDPNVTKDFQLFAQQTGNELLEQQQNGNEYSIYLRRK